MAGNLISFWDCHVQRLWITLVVRFRFFFGAWCCSVWVVISGVKCRLWLFIELSVYLQIQKANNNLEKSIGRHSIPNPKRFRRDEIQLTKQILVIIGVFIICNISSVATAIKAGTFGSKAHLFVSIGDLFITLNCSINVIIYGIFCPKFRGTFKKMFCACFKRKSEGTFNSLWTPMNNLQARVPWYELNERSQPTNFLRVSTYRR